MNNLKYIKDVKSYIASLKKDIEVSSETYKNRVSMMLPIAEQWLVLLTSGKIEKSEVENIAKRLFNIINAQIELVIIQDLFHLVSNWADKNGLSTTKIKNWKKELDVKFLKFCVRYYEQNEKDIEEGLQEGEQWKFGLVVAKKWQKLINSSSINQNDIDTIMNQLLLLDEPIGTMWRAMSYGIREWAAGNGFKVPSYDQLKEHFNSKFQNFINEIKKEEENKS
ncbi:MAG: hypothetical protein O6940_01335 [Ignavibacteria bacterium]|nr:hypothetical protein [Ignavibacteria bacterium]